MTRLVFTDGGDRKAATARLLELTEGQPSLMIPWFLMTSYLYYIHDVSLVEDAEFDKMCKRMLVHWDSLEHMHKHLIDREALAAGTGFYLKRGDYPGIVMSAAESIAKRYGFVTEDRPKKKPKRRSARDERIPRGPKRRGVRKGGLPELRT